MSFPQDGIEELRTSYFLHERVSTDVLLMRPILHHSAKRTVVLLGDFNGGEGAAHINGPSELARLFQGE